MKGLVSRVVFLAVIGAAGSGRAAAYDHRLALEPSEPAGTVHSWAAATYLEEENPGEGLGPSPFLAGLMSAVVPGSGQLAQGNARGWAYLGLDVISWFALISFRASGDQGLADSRKVADAHWDRVRYEDTPQGCLDSGGNQVGPVDLQEESKQLEDNYNSNRSRYYDDLARNPYACGWDEQDIRDQYRQMRSDANGFYSKGDWTLALMVVNRLVSAVDAGRTAAGRRRDRSGLNLESSWRNGGPEVTMAYQVGF